MGADATRSSSGESPGLSRSASARDVPAKILPATRGDCAAILQFLAAVFHGPSAEEFRTLFEDPEYDPHNRLLAACGSHVVGHVQVTPRTMQFGSVAIPVGVVDWLGVLPALRGRGHGLRLLAAAEEQLARRGALLGLLWTRVPEFFRRGGWAVCGRRFSTRAGTRELLAELAARGLYPRADRGLTIRPWRRVEMGSLVRLYNQGLPGLYGPFHRSEACWQWLAERHAYDQLYVAVRGSNRVNREDFNTQLLGYAAIRGDRIVELLTAPEGFAAGVDLLLRACSDAIECDRSTIALHAPPGHTLHELMRAGGNAAGHEAEEGEVLMARLLNPLKLLRLLGPELQARARASDLQGSGILELVVERKRYRLALSAEGVEVAPRTRGEETLALSSADFARMVLGYFDWDGGDRRRVQASSPVVLNAAQALFPRLPWWHPLLDDLPGQV